MDRGESVSTYVYLMHWRSDKGEEFGAYKRPEDAFHARDTAALRPDTVLAEVITMTLLEPSPEELEQRRKESWEAVLGQLAKLGFTPSQYALHMLNEYERTRG